MTGIGLDMSMDLANEICEGRSVTYSRKVGSFLKENQKKAPSFFFL